MVAVDYSIRSQTQINTQKLDIPGNLLPTHSARLTWLVSPFGSNHSQRHAFAWWIPVGSLLPAFLIFVILFFEVELIGVELVNKKRGLKKGTGFNLDIVLGSLMMVFNSFFGLPWLCAAPVRTVAHWASLTTYSETHIPGEKSKLVAVSEQRISALLVHIGIGEHLVLLFIEPFVAAQKSIIYQKNFT